MDKQIVQRRGDDVHESIGVFPEKIFHKQEVNYKKNKKKKQLQTIVLSYRRVFFRNFIFKSEGIRLQSSAWCGRR